MAITTLSTSRRTLAGAGLLIGSRLGTRAIDFVSLLVLAHFLTPADFGIVATGMTLVQLMEAMLELPVTQVLVRSGDLTPSLTSTAFTLSLMRGIGLACILMLIAFPFSIIYHDHRLVGLISFLSLSPAFRSLVSPNMVVFSRAIDFRREVALELVAKVAALCVAASAAVSTGSYWAIAAGTVCSPFVLAIGSYIFAPYRPRLTLSEWPVFASFFGWTTAGQVMSAINWQADRPILGLFVPTAMLGRFSIANDLSLLPEQSLIKPIQRPLLSGFALIKDDKARLGVAYLRATQIILVIGVPFMVGLAFLALPATRLLLGAKWMAAAPMVQWLALTLILPLFCAPMGSLAMALARTYIFFRQTLIEMSIRLPTTFLLAWKFGVTGLLVSRFILSLSNTSTSMFCVKEMIGLSYWRQIAVGLRPLIAGVAMGATLIVLRTMLVPLSGPALAAGMVAVGAAGMTVYLLVLGCAWQLVGQPEGPERIAATFVLKRLGRHREVGNAATTGMMP